MEVQYVCAIESHDDLGEGPIWDDAEALLYWIDATGRKLRRGHPGQARIEDHAVDDYPGCLALRRGGGLIVALRRSINLFGPKLFEPGGSRQTALPCPDIDFARERFNDGAVDRAGRFWAGTMHNKATERIGKLYRVDADLSVHRMAGDLCVSNGIAWSLDDRVMYHCDSRPGQVFAYDFDLETGGLRNRRVFFDFQGRAGHPDGCTLDAEGLLWVAEIGAGQLLRLTPDGRVERSVKLPVSRPTSVAFGGPGLRTLFVTSMRYGLNEAELAEQPQAGNILALDVGVAGLPEPHFGNG